MTSAAPPIQFTQTSDGVNIAYMTLGDGPTVLLPPGWISHLEQEWQTPARRAMLERLARSYRVVRYDKRGTGLSDRDVEDLSLDGQVLDLTAVIDAVGVEQFALYGRSAGGPPSITYTAANPERVRCLMLYGSYAAGPTARGEEPDPMHPIIRADWGIATRAFADRFMPSMAASREAVEAFAAAQRISATAEVAAKLWMVREHLDVRHLLPEIRVPTLVIHLRDDQVVPLERGRELASHIPKARFALLEGSNHMAATEEEREAIGAAVDSFLAEMLGDEERSVEAAAAPRSAFRTIVFTDIEASTTLTDTMGDERARAVLREHERVVRDAFHEHGGSEIKTMGDGFMVSFASASDGLDAAIAMQQAVSAEFDASDTPIRIRVGINAGEPIDEDDDLFGTAVIRASRVMSLADGGEILATDVVRQLVAGKDYLFGDRGETVLKGFDEPVRLFEVRWQR